MTVRPGPGTDFEPIRCMCGWRTGGELIVPVGARMATKGVRLRFKCNRCRDVILRHAPELANVSQGRLLVMQVLDLHTGEVDPDEVGIWKDHARGDRSATRGGERLPRRILDDALARARSGV